MGDYPWMTDLGTFVINGAERVVVSQLVRSPGVYYSDLEDPASGRMLFSAKVIPNRGAWLEFETNNKDQLSVKVDRKRKIAATTLLRAVGYETNDEIARSSRRRHRSRAPVHRRHPREGRHPHASEALIEVYKKLRPGDPPTGDNARQLVESLFFNFRRYDLGRVGRYKFNKKLDAVAERMGIELSREGRTITREDIAAIVGHLIECNRGLAPADDIDHLGNRRIRANGELIQNAFRIGLLRMERVVRERMTIQEIDKATPERPHQHPPGRRGDEGVLRRQPAQPVHGPDEPAGRAHRASAASRPSAPAACRASAPASTSATSTTATTAGSARSRRPEGPNIGLIGSLATYGRINSYGFIETPYRKVKRTVAWDDAALLEAYEAGHGPRSPRAATVVLKAGATFSDAAAAELKKQKAQAFPIRPIVTDEIEYLAGRRGGGARRRPGRTPARRRRPLRRRARPVALPGPVPGGAPGPDRVHGRLPQAGRLGRDRAHPVPRARRRQPGPHGLEHAAPGRAAPRARGARSSAPAWRSAPPATPARSSSPREAGVVTSVTAERIRVETDAGELDEYRAPEVRPQQPGHLHQPAPDRRRRPAGRSRRGHRRQQLDRPRRARPRPERPRGVHELGGRQLRGRDRHQRSPRPRRPLHEHPHREARDRVARHQARARGDHPRHPERRRGVPQGPRRGGHRLHRRRGPPRRHPRRQDHPEGRDRADGRGAPAAGDLRREGPRGEGLARCACPTASAARSSRSASSGASSTTTSSPASTAWSGCRVAQKRKISRSATRWPAATATRASSPRSCRRGHAVPAGRHARSTSSSTRSACRAG